MQYQKVKQMPLSIAIVDDVALDIDQLAADIARLSPKLSCARFVSGDALLAEYEPGAFDLIFMDVLMDGSNGIETARKVRQLDPRCLIVFLTSSREHVWQSFEMHPFDYLIKPYAPGQIARILDEATRALALDEPEIEIRVARRTVHLPLRSIMYAVAENHYVSIMTDTGEQRTSGTFSELIRQLSDDARFLQCNRGVLVNMDAVLKFDSDRILMRDGTHFPVRQRDKSALFNRFTQYQFRHMRKER